MMQEQFPGGSGSKEPACQPQGDRGLIPGQGRSPCCRTAKPSAAHLLSPRAPRATRSTGKPPQREARAPPPESNPCFPATSRKSPRGHKEPNTAKDKYMTLFKTRQMEEEHQSLNGEVPDVRTWTGGRERGHSEEEGHLKEGEVLVQR